MLLVYCCLENGYFFMVSFLCFIVPPPLCPPSVLSWCCFVRAAADVCSSARTLFLFHYLDLRASFVSNLFWFYFVFQFLFSCLACFVAFFVPDTLVFVFLPRLVWDIYVFFCLTLWPLKTWASVNSIYVSLVFGRSLESFGDINAKHEYPIAPHHIYIRWGGGECTEDCLLYTSPSPRD